MFFPNSYALWTSNVVFRDENTSLPNKMLMDIGMRIVMDYQGLWRFYRQRTTLRLCISYCHMCSLHCFRGSFLCVKNHAILYTYGNVNKVKNYLPNGIGEEGL